MQARRADLVLILAPYGPDAELLIGQLATAGIDSLACDNVPDLIQQYRAGVATIVIADEALKQEEIRSLSGVLAEQPPWSDLPVLLRAGGGITKDSEARLRRYEPLGNLTFLQWPMDTFLFVSAVRTALRARRRQYHIKQQMEQQGTLTVSATENEEKLTFALESGRLGAWDLEFPSKELTASAQFKRNFGIPPEQQFSYEMWRESVHPEDLAAVEEILAQSFATRTSFETEYRILRADGTAGSIFSAGRPVYNDRVGTGRVIGVTQDFTERRRGHDALRERESELRALADSMPQLAWMANPDGHIFWYNRRWYEYTGTTFVQMEGWGWERVHDAAILPQVLTSWKHAIDNGTPFEMEFPLRSASGEYRWFLTQARPVYGSQGAVVRWLGTNTDIDDKRRAEKALRESEELARSVIEHSPDCVEVLSREGVTLLVNASVCHALGWKDVRVGIGVPWIDTWHGEDRRRAQQALRSALEGEVASFEAAGRMGSTSARRWEVIVTPIMDAESAVGRLLCVSRDITARLRAEEEMRQTAKLESLGVMAGGIAHDFNNLLTGILGNASLLVETAVPDERTMAESIVLAATRASDLTRQMLAYSGKGRFETQKMNLSALVNEMLRLVRPALGRNVEIDVDGCTEPHYLDADPGQIQQVIMNLVINGGEALDGKAGKVVVRTGRVVLRSGMAQAEVGRPQLAPGEYVSLEVRDTGMGMDEATRARIFDPFFTTKFTGRGLGLAAVSGIVRGHRGALQVTSEPGVGSVFRVLFPAAESGAQPSAATKPSPVKTGSGLILLVDDESIVQRTGAAVLSRHGYTVQLASNGKEAVDMFREMHQRIDAVILDVTMPVMNGEQAIEQIREIDADVPVIVCSGFSETEVARRFQLQKVSSFLQKPYSASTLVSKLQTALGEPAS